MKSDGSAELRLGLRDWLKGSAVLLGCLVTCLWGHMELQTRTLREYSDRLVKVETTLAQSVAISRGFLSDRVEYLHRLVLVPQVGPGDHEYAQVARAQAETHGWYRVI